MLSKKILLVEDSETAVSVEELIADKGPYQLVTAKDGDDAFSKAVEEQPDLIFLDVFRPDIDGLGACRKLKECDTTKAIPIIMVTAKGKEEDVVEAYQSGCDDYIAKPIDGSELESKVKTYLEK